jgi:hypothetical protein
LHHAQALKSQTVNLYYLKTAPDRIEMMLWLLAEGVDISIMVRYTGHADSTITRWLERMGAHSTVLHNHTFQGLVLTFVQLDELHAKVRTGVQWLWLAIDPVTKIIPSLHLGGCRQADAYALLHDLHLRLDKDCVPAFTSDGLRSYFYAITAHFGSWFRPERARTGLTTGTLPTICYTASWSNASSAIVSPSPSPACSGDRAASSISC